MNDLWYWMKQEPLIIIDYRLLIAYVWSCVFFRVVLGLLWI